MIPHDSSEEYSSWLLPTVSRLLGANSLAMADVEAYAVAVGPGSFTGVRVGLTTVKAWGEFYGREIAPVSRLEAVASRRKSGETFVVAFLDGSRSQVFGALYEDTEDGLQLIGEERVMDPESFLDYVRQNAKGRTLHWLSSDPEKIEETALWRASKDIGEPIQRVSPYLAETIGVIGYERVLKQQTVNSLSLDANYVRRPDAEVFWKGAGTAKMS
jgi:tRNA threonylcarbamoyladenosine biosynthesis protein TsaB